MFKKILGLIPTYCLNQCPHCGPAAERDIFAGEGASCISSTPLFNRLLRQLGFQSHIIEGFYAGNSALAHLAVVCLFVCQIRIRLKRRERRRGRESEMEEEKKEEKEERIENSWPTMLKAGARASSSFAEVGLPEAECRQTPGD